MFIMVKSASVKCLVILTSLDNEGMSIRVVAFVDWMERKVDKLQIS